MYETISIQSHIYSDKMSALMGYAIGRALSAPSALYSTPVSQREVPSGNDISSCLLNAVALHELHAAVVHLVDIAWGS